MHGWTCVWVCRIDVNKTPDYHFTVHRRHSTLGPTRFRTNQSAIYVTDGQIYSPALIKFAIRRIAHDRTAGRRACEPKLVSKFSQGGVIQCHSRVNRIWRNLDARADDIPN